MEVRKPHQPAAETTEPQAEQPAQHGPGQPGPPPQNSQAPGAAQPAEGTAAGQEAVPELTLEELQGELDATRERLMRTQAELENFRKRMQRQMEEERRYALVPLLRDLLQVLDNLQRAVKAGEQAGKDPALLEGVRMVATQMFKVLEQHGCVPIPAKGKPFDPHYHEAVERLETTEHPPGTVVDVVQTGFKLHDRVVRPSRVVVAVAPEQEAAGGDVPDQTPPGETSPDAGA